MRDYKSEERAGWKSADQPAKGIEWIRWGGEISDCMEYKVHDTWQSCGRHWKVLKACAVVDVSWRQDSRKYGILKLREWAIQTGEGSSPRQSRERPASEEPFDNGVRRDCR